MALFSQALPKPVAAPKPLMAAAPKPIAPVAAPKMPAVNPYLAPMAQPSTGMIGKLNTLAGQPSQPLAAQNSAVNPNYNPFPNMKPLTPESKKLFETMASTGGATTTPAPTGNTISPELAQAYLASKGFTGQATGGAGQKYIDDNKLGADYGAFQQYVNSPAGQAAMKGQAPGVQTLDVASMNDYQRTALERLGQGTGELNPNIGINLQNATNAAARLSNPYDYNSYKNFMNPYIDEVISRNADDINRSYNVNRNQINEDFAGAGGFGSTAQGVERSRTNEAEARQIGDMSAQLRAQGYDTSTGRAIDLYGTGLNAASTQAGIYGNIAQQQQGLDQYGRNVVTTDLQNKLAAGGQIQAQNQKELDAYFAERDKAFNYPYVNADFYKNILQSYPTGTTQTSTTPGVGAVQGAIGGGLLGSSIANSYGNTGTQNGYGTYSTQGALPWQKPGATYPIY